MFCASKPFKMQRRLLISISNFYNSCACIQLMPMKDIRFIDEYNER